MKIKSKQLESSRIDFFYYAFRNVLFVSVPLVIISTIILSLPNSSATNSGTDNLTITISSACTLSSVVDSKHSTNTNVGTYTSDIGKTTITTLCNDGNGYSVYAVGYSNNEEGNNRLINTDPNYSNHSIETGLNTSGLISQWAMKLNNIPDDPSPTPPSIESDYNDVYGIVPPYWTKIAERASGTTDMAQGSSFTTTYAVYTSSSQYAGTYQGQVKYLLTHPNSDTKHFFMQDVANWKDQMLPHEGDSIQAVDERDEKQYWVTRLADGHIWMTQNLDFDITANATLNSNTTDLNVVYDSSTGQYTEYNDGYTESNGVIYYAPASSATTIDFQNTGPIIGWQNSNTTPYTANKTDSTETGHASLGNYYNWSAAIASNNSSSLTQDTINDISKNPKNSICPKGWRLPTISNQSETIPGSTNEFARLNYLYNNNLTNTNAGLIINPLWFLQSGQIDAGTASIYSVGLYSSSTVYSENSQYFMYFTPSTVRLSHNYQNRRSLGFSVRCVAR